MKTSSTAVLAVVAATALAAAGCGSSKSSGSTKAASTHPSETTGSAAATTTPAAPTATTASGESGTVITVKHASKLGSVLAAGPKRMTVYLFEADKGDASSCSGACAAAGPPVTSAGAPVAHGAASGSELGTIKRADGTMQVTYKGHPLYFFVKDKDSGDAYGEGVNAFGAAWYVLAPSGNKVDNS
jgi:predicted lipoprotein with Yx(FWY)xxD motif